MLINLNERGLFGCRATQSEECLKQLRVINYPQTSEVLKFWNSSDGIGTTDLVDTTLSLQFERNRLNPNAIVDHFDVLQIHNQFVQANRFAIVALRNPFELRASRITKMNSYPKAQLSCY